MPFPWIPVAATAASLIGSWFGTRQNKKSNERANQINVDMQEEFARNGLRWRIEDAQRAGIHPLAAMGFGGVNFSPMQVGDTSMGDFYSRAGQDIGRAISATSTRGERQMRALAVEEAQLRNAILRKELQGVGPGFPSYGTPTGDTFLSGQGDAPGDPRVLDVPLRRTFSDPRDPSKEAGAIPDYQIVRTGNGYAVVPAADTKQRIEDDWLAEQQWKIRMYSAVLNGLIRLPNGERAIPNPMSGELIPVSFFKRQGSKFKNSFMNDAKSYFKWRP